MKYTDTDIEKLIADIQNIEGSPEFAYDLDAVNFQEDFAFLEGYQDGRAGRDDRAKCAYENLLEKMEDMTHE